MALKLIAAVAATAALAFSASAANATVFAGNWTLTIGDNSDPGHLKIFTDTTDGTYSKDLTLIDSDYVDLFKIWTTEGSIEADDLNGTQLTLTFNFTSPLDNNGPVIIDGASNGYKYGFLGRFQGGQLIWDNGGVGQLQWGNNTPNVVDPGRMTLTVDGGRFNDGEFWATDRDCNLFGAHCNAKGEALGVSVKFDWDNDPTVVPEPATWALMIGGFGMAGATLRRRRAIAA